MGVRGGTGLLERERELAAAARLLEAAIAGDGRVLVIEAPAGIGKTALLAAVRTLASDAGMSVMGARAGELEAGLAFGVTRELLTGAVMREPEGLLRGAAALAGPVLGFEGPPPARGGDPLAAALHGLYWLCAELAVRRPLLLAVDDAHWADTASLRFLAYLGRRLEGLPVAVAVAARPHEPGAERALLESIVHDSESVVLRLEALSGAGAAALIRELAPDCPEALAAACCEATGGNPFLIPRAGRLASRGPRPGHTGESPADWIGGRGAIGVRAPGTAAGALRQSGACGRTLPRRCPVPPPRRACGAR